MAEVTSIYETPTAVIADCVAYIWEEYDAPRKRVKRARPIAHPFNISIPKVDESAAPVAFVIEHFPRVNVEMNRIIGAPYDEPVRAYAGRFYTPARMNWRNHSEPDPRVMLKYAAQEVPSIAAYNLDSYRAFAARDEIRADQAPAYYPRANHVTEQVARWTPRSIIINGAVWDECDEPVYKFVNADHYKGRTRPAFITVETDHSRAQWSMVGALNHAELAIYFPTTARLAYIDVKRPDLVTIDTRLNDLKAASAKADNAAQEARENLKRAREALATARENVTKADEQQKKAREELAQYERSPRDYYQARLEKFGSSLFGKKNERRTAALARIIDRMTD